MVEMNSPTHPQELAEENTSNSWSGQASTVLTDPLEVSVALGVVLREALVVSIHATGGRLQTRAKVGGTAETRLSFRSGEDTYELAIELSAPTEGLCSFTLRDRNCLEGQLWGALARRYAGGTGREV